MIKRFTKGRYTLALVKGVNGEPYTFSRNVSFLKREKNLVWFTDSSNRYEVNINTREVKVEPFDFCEEDEWNCSLANIIKGFMW